MPDDAENRLTDMNDEMNDAVGTTHFTDGKLPL